MEFWQTGFVLLSFLALAGVGASLARRNWHQLMHGSVIQSGGATFMADEWRLSHEGRVAIWQGLLVAVGVFLAGEGVVFSLVGLYTLLFP